MAILLAPDAASARPGEVASSRTSGTWPAWSPNGRKIAFTSVSLSGSPGIDVYAMNADGSGQRRLTRNGAQDSNPTWAPNSRKIVFQSDLSGDFEIWVMRADGTAPHQLTRG